MDLNIRNFPDELVREMKQQALDEGTTLREVVIARCGSRTFSGVQQKNYAAEKLEHLQGSTSGTGLSRQRTTTRSTGTKKHPAEKMVAEFVEQAMEPSEKLGLPEQCEHGRDPEKCLACDWVRRNK